MYTLAINKDNFKQNYNPQIVERRRAEQLMEQQAQRDKEFDSSRPLRKKSGKMRKYHVPTLIDNYKLDLSLQLSQWMVWPPEKMKNWLLVPCPVGYRCLVVAHMGRTEIYAKSGQRVCSYESQLPGDSKALTALDCVHDVNEDVLYVLDAIHYGQQNLQHCEANFRYFWLKTQFQENPYLCERTNLNEKPLRLINHHDCGNEEMMRSIFMEFPIFPANKPKLAGFLFYHKAGSYTFGTTNLVGWIFPFMIKDVFGMEGSKEYVKPADYQSVMQYIYQFDAKAAAKASKPKPTVSMQTDAHLKRSFDEIDDSETSENDLAYCVAEFDLSDIIDNEPPKSKTTQSQVIETHEPIELMDMMNISSD